MPSHLKRLYSKVGSRLSELSIGIKLTIALLCCAVFTPLALVAYTSFMEEKTLLERQRQEIQHRLDTESFFIKSLFDTASRDVVFLSQVPAVRIFSSTDFSLGRKTLETRMLDQFSKINSTEVFVDFLKTNPLYRRLTYLDIDGIERLRIDQSEGEILLLDEKLLENRFEWDYFNQTVLMSEGEVYISDIAFDSPDAAENGEFDPVIRLATQVYDKPGNLQGVLVIDMSGGILQNTARGKMPGNGAIFLIDSEGYYLAHHDAAKRWSRQRGNRHTVQADFPALKDLPHRLSGEDVRYIHVPGSEIFISPIVSDFGQTQKWYIVDVIPSSMFADSSRFYFLIVLSISFLGIVLSLLIGYAFSKIWILNPIKELTAMTGKIAQGIFTTVSLKNHQEDEIGKLCDSFNRMSDALAKAERDRKTHFDKLNWEIAERKKAEADLKLHKTFFEQSTDAMFIADSEARFTYINPAFSKITGYSTHETIGRQTEILHSEKHDQDFYRKVWKTVQKKGYWQGEVWECRKGKQHFPALQTINTIINENGDTHYVSIFKDISSLKEAENELWKLAHFDQLTNLANRKLLEERINQAISEAYRHKRVGSMIFLDLDNFKHINDSLGHNYGDLMLKEIAARLKAVFRSEDTVARLGGDEYIVLLPDLADSAD
ncbi:MAG: diguanylate cyclase domain-containing protein, partial [Gammaproteobacteria bacterium]